MDFDVAVKLHIYQTIAETARVPRIDAVAVALSRPASDIEQSFRRIAAKRLLVLEPDTSEIRMAPPFSAVETPLLVHTGGKSYYAPCVWDSLGVSAALHQDATVDTTCGDCGAPMTMEVRGGAVVPQDCAVHFAVPAAHWWDDIVFS